MTGNAHQRPRSLDERSVLDHLRRRGLLDPATTATVELAGDGNINWVRRVRSSEGKTWIVKQARAQLERFPEYQADTKRIVVEVAWLELAASMDPDKICPTVLDFDEAERILVLEDCGDVPRLDEALLTDTHLEAPLNQVGALLGRIHAATRVDESLLARFENTEMRNLHFAHIFELPFQENDFPLPPPVASRAAKLKDNKDLLKIIMKMGHRCRTERRALVHGDPQPGNILLTKAVPKLIDAEIAHIGVPALDPATLIAHLLLSGIARNREDELRRRADALWNGYATENSHEDAPSFHEVSQLAAVEMLRRTIGAARVAAVREIDPSLHSIDTACRLLESPAKAPKELEFR